MNEEKWQGIATHSTKFLNPKLKQNALCADVISSVPEAYICSKTTQIREKYWASPLNSADMKIANAFLEDLKAKNQLPENYIPSIEDHRVSQVLLPKKNWQDGHYVSVTPVSSLGMVHENHSRISDLEIYHKAVMIQPNAQIRSNQSYLMNKIGGAIKALRDDIDFNSLQLESRNNDQFWKGDFVELTGTAQGVDVFSGALAYGLPALTAIGGFVHVIERLLGVDIEFAFGIKGSTYQHGQKMSSQLKAGSGSVISGFGRIESKSVSAVLSAYNLAKRTANFDFVLMLRSNKCKLEAIKAALNKINNKRIAGGSVFNEEIKIKRKKKAEKAFYITDFSKTAQYILGRSKNYVDALDVLHHLYQKDIRNKGYRYFTANQVGFGLLETPEKRANLRQIEYMHAWAESIHGTIMLGHASKRMWFSKIYLDHGIIYRNIKR